jgi:hypothetical protein
MTDSGSMSRRWHRGEDTANSISRLIILVQKEVKVSEVSRVNAAMIVLMTARRGLKSRVRPLRARQRHARQQRQQSSTCL